MAKQLPVANISRKEAVFAMGKGMQQMLENPDLMKSLRDGVT
jgi:hypothetical protein